jgi:hypothetical protein
VTLLLTVVKWLTGGFLDTLAKAWTVKVQSDADLSKSGVTADRDVLLKQLDNNLEVARLAAAARAADRGSLWTAWMMPAIAAPIILHVAAVAFDSNVLLGHVAGSWSVPPMPGTYGEWEGWIVAAIIGKEGAVRIARVFKS